MSREIDSKQTFVDEVEKDLGPLEERVDEAWCSELCKKKISTAIIAKYPCRQRFSGVDVIPLYACGRQRFYRVTLWVDDWSANSLAPAKEIWKTFYIVLEGIERKIVSIEECKKKPLRLSEKGKKFREEFKG